MTLFLVRHGKAVAGIEHLDPGLDEVGKSQAAHAAAALKRFPATRIVCSPLLRARETARPISDALGLPVEIVPEVSEVFDPNMTLEARGALLMPMLSGYWSKQSDELRAWRDRLLGKLVELGQQDKTIVVSHFVAISAAIGASTEDDRVSPCALANASITTLEVQGGKLQLRRAGEVAHLDRDEITATHAVIPGKR